MSEFFRWDPAKLSLQIPEMDDEHKVLIGMMNDLHTLNESSRPVAEQLSALDRLVRYTAKHFADEEVYMERIGFPGLRIHKGVHKQLLDRLGEFLSAARSSQKLPEDLFVFFKMWLSAHICGIDTKYAQHARTLKSA
ncbi:MAG: hemerythrin family protein [Steroidobacteraceae bacterium]|nr:hemerythrin family protein [Steroidobacteraceae bacterium]